MNKLSEFSNFEKQNVYFFLRINVNVNFERCDFLQEKRNLFLILKNEILFCLLRFSYSLVSSKKKKKKKKKYLLKMALENSSVAYFKCLSLVDILLLNY